MFSFQHWFLPLFSGAFIVDCIYFFMNVSSGVFISPLILQLFFECFHFTNFLCRDVFLSGTLFLCCCCSECYGFERAFFKLGRFLPYDPSRLWHNLLLSKPSWASSSASKVARPPTQVRNTVTAHLFVWTTQCSAKGISR